MTNKDKEPLTGEKPYLSTDPENIYLKGGYARRFPITIALFLSKLHWHCLESTRGKEGLQDYKGKKFVIKTRQKWASDCGITVKQIDSAIMMLKKKGIIATENHLIRGGSKVMHVRYLLLGDKDHTDTDKFYETLTQRLEIALSKVHESASEESEVDSGSDSPNQNSY